MENDDFIPDEALIHSYVHCQSDGFTYYVSTINRNSSAIEWPSRYAETIVWEWKLGKRQKIVGMGEGLQGSIKSHLEICQKVFDGTFFQQED